MRKIFSYCYYASACSLGAFLLIPTFSSTVPNEFISHKFDAIIVLGGGLTGNCGLDPSLKARMEMAIQLYEQKKAAKLIVSGGIQPKNNSCIEAIAMKQFALSKNVPEAAIMLEQLARNTYENAYYSTDLMEGKGMKSAIIVTSDFHAKRANIIFEEYPIKHQVITAISKTTGYQKYSEWCKEQLLLCFHTLFGVPNNFGMDLKEQNFTGVLRNLAQN